MTPPKASARQLILRIASRELATPPLDTGLRFSQVSLNTDQCPACAEVINLTEDAHGKED